VTGRPTANVPLRANDRQPPPADHDGRRAAPDLADPERGPGSCGL